MAQAGGQPFIREAPMSKTNAETQGPARRPADILLRAWQGGQDTAVDVTVVHPLQVAQLPWTRMKAESFLKQAESRKVTNNESACKKEGWAFIPAAFDTWGGMGPKAKDVFHRLLARSVASTPMELQAARKGEHRQHLSLALMRQVWKLLSAKNHFD